VNHPSVLSEALVYNLLEILQGLLPLSPVQLALRRKDFVCQILAYRVLEPLTCAVFACALKVAVIKLFAAYPCGFHPISGQEVENQCRSLGLT
jgi:hypothetical protein